MRRRKGNPKVRNLVLLLACAALFLVLVAFLIMNHQQEAKTSQELNKMATEQLQSEKSENEGSWTEDQNQAGDQSQADNQSQTGDTSQTDNQGQADAQSGQESSQQ